MVESVYEKIPVPVIIVEPETFIILYANKRARRITDLTSDTPKDAFLSDIFTSGDFERLRKNIFESKEDNAVVLENVSVICDGQEETYHIYAQPVSSGKKDFLQIQLHSDTGAGELPEAESVNQSEAAEHSDRFSRDELLQNELLALLLVSSDLKLKAFNKQAEEKAKWILNAELELGKDISVYFPGKIDASYEDTFKKVNNGESLILPVHFGYGKEEQYVLRFFLQPLFDESGNVSDILISMIDRSEIRNAQKIAEQADEKLESVLTLSIDAVMMIDTQHRIVLFNKAAEEIFKYELYEVIGQSIEKLIPSRFHGVYFNKVSGFDTSRNERHDPAAIRGVRKNGTELPLELTFIPLETGGNRFYLLLMRNISKRKALEEKLHKQRSLFRAVADNVSDLILHYDNEGVCVYVSNNSIDLLGFQPSEILHSNLFDDIHKADIPVLRSAQLQMREDGTPITVPVRRMNKQQEFLSFENILTPVMSFETGKFESIAVVARQIDSIEKDKNEATQKALAAALEGDSNEELKNLAQINKQLTVSEKKLKETIASKDKFFSIIAHDLRGPFTGLLGVAEFLCEDIDDLSSDEIQQYSGSIYKSARAVFNLLDNLLQWSRVQTGRIEFQPAKLFIDDLINQVIEIFRQNAAEKEITFHKEIDKDCEINADRNMIDTILRNLFSNAIKFTNRGGVITITMKQEAAFARVSVADNGVGMPDEIINKLFRIDSHITSEGTEREKGTGLGLILCKDFVEMNGGTINVTSTPGKGSKFIFTIPRA